MGEMEGTNVVGLLLGDCDGRCVGEKVGRFEGAREGEWLGVRVGCARSREDKLVKKSSQKNHSIRVVLPSSWVELLLQLEEHWVAL